MFVRDVPEPESDTDDSAAMRQSNVRYPPDLLREAKAAAEWEGIGLAAYFRSALKARLRETDVKKATHERRLGGERIAE